MADSGIEIEKIEVLDAESEFLGSNRETGNEWELFKENVRPLKRGRKVEILNDALKAQTDNQLKKSLFEQRRRLIQAIDEYVGDDPLQPWLECIKWVQEAFPPGGDFSGLVVIYEQCVRTFWHSDRYKDDLCYLKVWLEYAENCVDAEVIFSFLDANEIGKSHSQFYISYALLMESKNKVKAANELLNLGISRNAQPVEKLNDAFRKFIARSMRRPPKAPEEDSAEKRLPTRSFGTVLANRENCMQTSESSGLLKKNVKLDRGRVPLSIYKEDSNSVDQSEVPKRELNSWHTLGPRAERNKENTAIPSTWTSFKIRQRPVPRVGGAAATSARIEIFIDQECEETHKMNAEGAKSSTVQPRQGEEQELKKETELLRQEPLRNFPLNSLPR
ncbi:hypothetical protein ACLB2K_047430 [Fragaria x ananassa]